MFISVIICSPYSNHLVFTNPYGYNWLTGTENNSAPFFCLLTFYELYTTVTSQKKSNNVINDHSIILDSL